MEVGSKQQWQEAFDAYKSLIRDPHHDSEYLRRTGLVPHIVDLLGDVSQAHVLDAGCGTGWLFDTVAPRSGHECDLVAPPQRPQPNIKSQCQDVRALTYDDDSFDIVVSSLVLMWLEDVEATLCELHRVTRPGGRLIVALMHPYFHTNGHTLQDGSFLVDRPVGGAVRREIMISGLVGPLTYYARTPLDYYNAAVRARWQLIHFRDYFIDLERYRSEAGESWPSARRTDKVPLFTF
ncbi:MAG: class I SAM-dependent methyltransferase, partial [Actinoplanes sp.]